MDAMAWLWAGALSLVAFVMGVTWGLRLAASIFARRLVEYGLTGLYIAAMDARDAREERHP